jgi:hypothetical protein
LQVRQQPAAQFSRLASSKVSHLKVQISRLALCYLIAKWRKSSIVNFVHSHPHLIPDWLLKMFSILKSRILKTIGVLAMIAVLTTSIIVTIAVKAENSRLTSMTLIQEKPTLFTYNNAPGEVPGRKTYYAAELTKPSGEAFGLLTGNVSSIAPVQGNPEEARLRTLIFRLPEGQIIAMGNSVYPSGAVEIDPNASITIAVIGGTGEYIGARGEVISTKNENGTYTHEFILRK